MYVYLSTVYINFVTDPTSHPTRPFLVPHFLNQIYATGYTLHKGSHYSLTYRCANKLVIFLCDYTH